MSTSSSNNKVILKSNDGETFEVDVAVASESEMLKNMLDDVDVDDVIAVANLTGKILSKVIEYCKKHNQTPKSADHVAAVADEELKAFDAEFVKVDQSTLFELILAANYLNIKGLLDLTCQTVADMIKGKTPQEIRMLFDIENDFTSDEEEKVRKESKWLYQ